MNLAESIVARAEDLGFDHAGVLSLKQAQHKDALRHWLDHGYAAGMSWMGARTDKREDPARVILGAKSLITVGLSYFAQEPPAERWNDPSRGRIARYAWGPDYHDVMLPMLRELSEFIASEVGKPVQYRAYVDTGPILERDIAEQAGLGFIGKNTMLISPQFGSLLFLGEIITDSEFQVCRSAASLREARLPAVGSGSKFQGNENPCGSCRRCLDTCPTQAFPEPYVLDARRCISYQTIENKGAIPEELRSRLGNWIFGCDECQSVCPWVKKFSKPGRKRFLKFEPETCAPLLTDLLQLNAAAFKELFRGTPVIRAKRRGLLRNVAVALGNWGDPSALPVLEQAMQDSEPLVREHAEWAVGRIKNPLSE